MDTEDLRTFVDVADAGGVSSAARRLGVSKSIVSRRLFRLEAELGVQLLARATRGAALTEAGVTFRDHSARGLRRNRTGARGAPVVRDDTPRPGIGGVGSMPFASQRH